MRLSQRARFRLDVVGRCRSQVSPNVGVYSALSRTTSLPSYLPIDALQEGKLYSEMTVIANAITPIDGRCLNQTASSGI